MVPSPGDVAVHSFSTRVTFLLICIYLISCAAPPAAEKNAGPAPDVVHLPLAPGSCRFAGTVTEILPVEKSAGGGACAAVPCMALVRIDTVLGYGAAFSTPLAAGMVLKIRFPFTLRPTRALFPSMRDLPPPLAAGDALTAVVSTLEVLSTGEAVREYSVTTYSPSIRSEHAR